MPKPRKKLCLVSSPGGHLYKLSLLKKWWGKYEHFIVSKQDPTTHKLLSKERTYQAFFPENRNFINLIKNFILAIIILNKEKPTHLFSTGAGVAVPFFLVGKLLGIKTIFMETFILIPQATLTGKLLYYFTDYFIVQNKQLLRIYPKAKYWGSVL